MSETKPKIKKKSKTSSNKLCAVVYVNSTIYSYPKVQSNKQECLSSRLRDSNGSAETLNEFNLHKHFNVSINYFFLHVLDKVKQFV